MRKLTVQILSLVVTAGALGFGLFQNCAPARTGTQVTTNAPSPFQDTAFAKDGISLSAGLRSRIGGAAATGMANVAQNTQIPANTKLGFIVDDACMKDRITGPLDRYFLDRFTNRAMELTPTKPFAQSVVAVTLPRAFEFSELVRIKRSDSCIVAIADDQGVRFKITASADPLRPQQDYLDRTQFDPDFFDLNVDVGSVTVAVIDSGYDFTNAEPITTVDSSLMIGTNRFNGNSLPQDDVGHGTLVTSLIAAKADNRGLLGVAARASKILPIRVLGKARTSSEKDGEVSLFDVFAAMKQSVNAGADVVNVSLGAPAGLPPGERQNGMPISCDPIIGQALFEAVDNNVFVVIAAGNMTRCELVNGSTVCFPGSVYSPKDNSTENLYEYNSIPACWARYYKGVLAVASTNSSGGIAAHSNWGEDAVEIAAPGEQVLGQEFGGGYVRKDGTSFAAPLVSGAVANTIAYFKKKGWSYNPWMIEDTIINGSPTVPALWDAAPKKVRLGKSLNFSTLTAYLTRLSTMSDDERRQQPSDNPEAGVMLNRSLAVAGHKAIKLEVYTKEKFIAVDRQAQIQAVVYYDDATLEVVSEQATWTSSNPAQFSISASGLAVPKARGTFTATARFGTLSATSSVQVVDFNTWNGSLGTLQSLKITPNWDNLAFAMYAPNPLTDLEIIGKYSDGRIRKVNDATTFFAREENGTMQVIPDTRLPNQVNGKPFWIGGRRYKIVVLYRGIRQDYDFTMPHWTITSMTSISPSIVTRFADTEARLNPTVNFLRDGEPGIYNSSALVAGLHYRFQATPRRSFAPGPMAVKVDNVWYVTVRPDANSVSSTLKWDWEDWGSGSAVPMVGQQRLDVIEATPVAVKFATGAFGASGFTAVESPTVNGIVFTGTAADTLSATIDRVFATGFEVIKVVPKVVFSSGSEKFIAKDAVFTIFNQDGSVSPLNHVVYSGGSYSFPLEIPTSGDAVAIYIWKSEPGETLTLRARDPASGLEANFPIKVRGSLPTAVPLDRPALPRIGLLAPKANEALCSTAAGAAAPFAGGTGTPSDPYLICTPAQFLAVSTAPSAAVAYKMMANLDLANVSQNSFPVKLNQRFCTEGNPTYDCLFDGNGFTIANSTIADAENTISILSAAAAVKISNLNLRNISIRGKLATLLVTPQSSKITNVHADQIYLEGEQVYGLALAGTLSNTSITTLSMKTNPRFGAPTAAGLLGSGSSKDCYVQIVDLFGAPGSSIGGISETAGLDKCLVEGTIRSGVSSTIGGLAVSVYDNAGISRSKASLTMTAPGATIGLLAANAHQRSVYTRIAAPPTISNSEFTGSVIGGSGSEGARVGLVNNCTLCQLSTNTATATINAYSVGGLAYRAALPWAVDNTVNFTLDGVAPGSKVAFGFTSRFGIGTEPIFTYLSNNRVNFNGVPARTIGADVNGQPADLPGVN